MPMPDTNHDVTFVLTSCGRIDLLQKTIETFEKYNTYPIKRGIITEDSCDPEVYEQVNTLFGDRYEIRANDTKKGQIQSIIEAYDTIDTPYVFHCEDDWEFSRGNFIEEAFAILDTDPKITQVFLRSEEDLNQEAENFDFGPLKTIGDYGYKKVTPINACEWGHYSFNPGIKRISDYHKMGGFKGDKSEMDVNIRYRDAGYYCVLSSQPAVAHLGDDRSVHDPTRVWKKRRKPNKPKGLKRLWGHIKNFKF